MPGRILLIVFFAFWLSVQITHAQQWRPVNGSRQSNISGMALVEHRGPHTAFLVVHDNKKKEQVHAGLLTIDGGDAPRYTPLQWKGSNTPVDLEAVTAIPGFSGQFVAFAADGGVFQVKFDAGKSALELIRSTRVPMMPSEPDFEGFAIQKINGKMIAVWAERGATEKPATLFWSNFDLATGNFSNVKFTSLTVPYPATNVRHVSDIKVDTSGAVFVTSASDPGNDGPFSSAFYFAGSFSAESLVFNRPITYTRLYSFDYHKVEAFELVPGADGGVAFGTDDENLGASVFLTF